MLPAPAAVLGRPLRAGPFNQNATHRLGSGREEVAAVGPVGFRVRFFRRAPHQPKISLMDQCRGLQSLSRFLLWSFRAANLRSSS